MTYESPKAKLMFNNAYEVGEWILTQINHAQAYENTMERSGEAHDYVHKYLMPDGIGWGQNVWHSILDDAIKMRKENK